MSDAGLIPSAHDQDSLSRRMVVLKLLTLFGLLYIFILSITLLGASFKLFGKDFAETIFQATSNPIVGLMIGLLTTSIIQSSSTTTSIIVGLVAASGSMAGDDGTIALTFEAAVPMVMGANIGTSVTNIIVSLGSISRGDDFKRAFAGSLLHDFFNVCSVIVLLPLQVYFNIIGGVALKLEEIFSGFGGLKFSSPLGAVTKPIANAVIHFTNDTGWLSALIALVLLFIALRYIVVVLKSMVLSRVEQFFQRFVFRTPILTLLLGIVLTAMVQSSSITTSLVVPLLGAGVLRMEQIYPYLLGANVGTTITAFLASFVTGSGEAVSVAFAHLMFNVYGIAIFWPLKRIPIWLSRKMAEFTQKSKLVPILYIIVVFFILPGLVLFIAN